MREYGVSGTKPLPEIASEGIGMAGGDDGVDDLPSPGPDGDKIVGSSREKMVGRHFFEFIPADQRTMVMEQWQRRLVAGPEPFEVRIDRPDGQFVYLLGTVTVLKDVLGESRGVMVTATDVTARRQLEDERRRLEEKYRQIIELAGEGVVVADAQQKITFVNRSMAQMSGYAESELLGRPIIDLFAAEDQSAAAAKYEEQRVGVAEQHELKMKHKDGGEFTVLVKVTPMFAEDGRSDGTLGMYTNVTDRVRAENSVLRTEADYRRLVETANEGIIVSNREGITTFVNNHLAGMLGYRTEEMLDRSMLDYVYEEDRSQVLARWYNQSLGMTEKYVLRLKRKDGSLIWSSNNASPLFDDRQRFIGSLTMSTDITEQQRVEAERERLLEETQREHQKAAETAYLLEKERVTLDAIMANTSAQLVYLDRAFNFVKVNRAYCEASGYTEAELIGRNHFTLFPNEENRAIFEKVRDTGETVRFHDKAFFFPHQPERGVTYWDWTLVAVKDARGEVSGLVLSVAETTERVRAEERLRQYERLATLGRVGGSISHELRNPLGTIDSSAYFLRSLLEKNGKEIPEALREKISTHLERVSDAVKRSTGIIQSLLDLTQLKEAKLSRTDLCTVISDLVKEAKVPDEVTVREVFPERGSPVNIDREQMRLAFHNILNNAIQAMDNKGTITLTIRNDPDYVVLSIADTGPGIATENLERVFQPLFSTKTKGIGFGLTIAQLVVERFGGKIKVESAPGQGAKFIISLPMAK